MVKKKFFKGSDYSNYDPNDYIEKNKASKRDSNYDYDDFTEDSDTDNKIFLYIAIALAALVVPICFFAIYWDNSNSFESNAYPILLFFSFLIGGAIIWYGIKDHILVLTKLIILAGGSLLIITIVAVIISEIIHGGSGCSWTVGWVDACY